MRIITLSWESKLLQVSKEFVAYAALNLWKVCLMSCSFSSISPRQETGNVGELKIAAITEALAAIAIRKHNEGAQALPATDLESTVM